MDLGQIETGAFHDAVCPYAHGQSITHARVSQSTLDAGLRYTYLSTFLYSRYSNIPYMLNPCWILHIYIA